ncbi:hypothetical protein AAG570_004346 [Ranatra chinensis]|uniref:Fatty acyl-CoA reductase n=1 Tax=Ranatra chinensis TaxID=642074 RepID=A0ABD0YD86_9HEMI
MGKVLLEKLLYSCPEINTIYVLMRPKRGRSVDVRLNDMINIPLFSRIRKECPERLKNLVAINGDVSSEGLGLDGPDHDRLVEEVSVVIHGAATLRLEAKLKDAVRMNTEGTFRVMRLCQQMKKLKVVVHMSTAFCHVDHLVMEEKVYPPPADPQDIMDVCRWMDDKTMDMVTPSLLKPHPNSYTYSKRLAEAVVNSFYPQLPAVICRPSIVCPTYRDPMPGWVDNLNGPMGLLMGASKGVIRTMHCNGEYTAEVIPVDMAISGIVAIAANIGSLNEMPKEIPVFNLTQSGTNVASWEQILDWGKKVVYENPSSLMLWYPNGGIHKNKMVHNVHAFLTHWVPAYVIDFLMLILGQKPFMLRIQRRIQDGLDVLQYFTTRQWNFKNDKILQLRDSMNDYDKEHFNLDFEKVKPAEYIKGCVLGAREFLFKEDPSTLPRSRRILKM